MRITTDEMVRTEITEDILCNGCGESCKEGDEKRLHEEFCGLIETTVHGSYWSHYLNDGRKYTFSLCEKCLTELFKTFAIQPEN
jgi:hypothetical protein